MVYKLSLMTHLVGLSLLFGTLIASFFLMQKVWKQVHEGHHNVLNMVTATARLSRLFGVGIILQILSGMTMMALSHGAYGRQLWMQTKLIIIVLVILNAVIFGRRQFNHISTVLAQQPADNVSSKLESVKSKLNLFYTLQLALFVGILSLSVFKVSEL